MDAKSFLNDLSVGTSSNKLRIGMARVVSVDSDAVFTITPGQAVISPGFSEPVTGDVIANYLGEYPPRPSGSCWYVTDGVDRIILGMMAPDGPPSASISLTSATATTTATNSTVVMTTVDYDPWNMTSTAATGITIPVGGMYAIAGFQTYGANGTGFRQITLRRNGSNLESVRLPTTSASNPIINLTMPGYPCNKGDIISMIGQQTSTGNLNMNAASLSVQYVGRRRGTAQIELQLDGGFESGLFNPAGSPLYEDAVWYGGTNATFVSAAIVGTAGLRKMAFSYNTLGGTLQAWSGAPIPVFTGQVLDLTFNLLGSNSDPQMTVQFQTSANPFFTDSFTTTGTVMTSSTQNFPTSTTAYQLRGTVGSGQRWARPAFQVTYSGGGNNAYFLDSVSIKEVIR
jgi:hypothetical protein